MPVLFSTTTKVSVSLQSLLPCFRFGTFKLGQNGPAAVPPAPALWQIAQNGTTPHFYVAFRSGAGPLNSLEYFDYGVYLLVEKPPWPREGGKSADIRILMAIESSERTVDEHRGLLASVGFRLSRVIAFRNS